jgi:hypothetical protein
MRGVEWSGSTLGGDVGGKGRQTTWERPPPTHPPPSYNVVLGRGASISPRGREG